LSTDFQKLAAKFLNTEDFSEKEIQNEIQNLRKTIEHFSRKYYFENESEISDADFDRLFKLLKNWEKKFPNLKTANSPTEKIVAPESTPFEKIAHLTPMISLANAVNSTELLEWKKRADNFLARENSAGKNSLSNYHPELDSGSFAIAEQKFKNEKLPEIPDRVRNDKFGVRGNEFENAPRGDSDLQNLQLATCDLPLEFTIEPKIDGLGISVVFENDKFIHAVTRGDGIFGENVSENFREIRGIPRAPQFSKFGISKIEIRGEIWMAKKDFENLNLKNLQNGEKVFANPRNAAAGTLRNLNSKIVAERNLKVSFFHFSKIETVELTPEISRGLTEKKFAGKKFDENFDEKNSEKKIPKQVRDDKFENFEIAPRGNSNLIDRGGVSVSQNLKSEIDAEKTNFMNGGRQPAAAGKISDELSAEKILQKLNFPPRLFLKKFEKISEVAEFCKKFSAADREKLPAEIDGLVVKFNDFKIREILKSTAHHPRWAIAFKFPAAAGETEILEIFWQTGRTGAVTPVAKLKPVEIGGVRIARATLHNADEILRKNLKIGATVRVERAGDVIPKITAVISTPENSPPIEFPEKCPSCGAQLFRRENEVALRCGNENCPGKNLQKIIYFCSKSGLEIENLGAKVCAQLLEKNFIADAADLFFLQKTDFLKLNLFAEKSAENAVATIAAAKNCGLEKLLKSLGIDFVGARAAKILAKNFENLDAIAAANFDSFLQIHEIGAKTAQSLVDFFSAEKNLKFVEKLRAAGVNFKSQIFGAQNSTGKLAGKTFVFTGKLENSTRGAAEKLVENLGGRAAKSVSAQTDFLVAGEKAGSKLKLAEKLKVKILSEKEFENLVSENIR
jgi:NAD-dependent DNA ligase